MRLTPDERDILRLADDWTLPCKDTRAICHRLAALGLMQMALVTIGSRGCAFALRRLGPSP